MSPTLSEASLTFLRKEIFGVLTLNFLFSTAALNRTQGIDFEASSFLTMGTEYCLSLIEKGSKPAINAEVSRTMALFVVRNFHLERKEAYPSDDGKSLL
jgi:hypothetical protein